MINQLRYKKLVNIGAELFPKMSVDRKTAAAFYTQEATAEFLANLTISEQDVDKDIFERIKIVDLACGTGTLLRAGYKTIKTMYEKNYGINNIESLKKIHTDAMEKGIIGLDIFPISTHLTASSLTIMGYGEHYRKMNIGMMPVGGPIGKTGSLEYLDVNPIQGNLFERKMIITGTEKKDDYAPIKIQRNTIDYVLMNPPYSRTSTDQGSFDITGISKDMRDACQTRWKKLLDDFSDKTVAKKSAGMAASFLILASSKLKVGGRLGFVLPLTMAFSNSWNVTRKYFTERFEDIIAITISGGHSNQQLSADTGMNEMLLIATKSKEPHKPSPIKCVTLETNFDNGIAIELARSVSKSTNNVTLTTPVFANVYFFQYFQQLF